MEGLKPGRIVYYVLTASDTEAINRRRSARRRSARPHTNTWVAGAQAHVGHPASARDVCPAVVTRVWSDAGVVNLKVLLDGNDDLWATSIHYDPGGRVGESVGTWHWMFEGQATRYQPDRVEVAPTSC